MRVASSPSFTFSAIKSATLLTDCIAFCDDLLSACDSSASHCGNSPCSKR
ncbi:Uncharacterised protein [Vibrio cholerae]|nr:Uncharacterised protein [Vibrio cholerae]